MLKSIFNCERFDILPYLQGNKLACCILMDVGRRHRKLGWSQRALLLMAKQVASVCMHCFHSLHKTHRIELERPN